MKTTLILTAILLIFVSFGCGKEPTESEETGGDFNVTVGSGMTPEISWDGGNAHALRIKRMSDNILIWYILTKFYGEPVNEIESPVTFGETPSGVEETFAMRELEKGIEYKCIISIFDESASVGGLIIYKEGWTEFTP